MVYRLNPVERDPSIGQNPTIIPGLWLSMLEDEIAAVVESAGISPDPLNNAQLLLAIQTLQAAGSSFRNKVDNADFFIDQRRAGASLALTTTPAWVCDRWLAVAGGSAGAATVSTNPNPAGVQPELFLPRASVSWQQTTNAVGTAPTLYQRIQVPRSYFEDPIDDYTLSFYAFGAAGSDVDVVARIVVWSGSASTAVASSAMTVPQGSGWTRYSFSAKPTRPTGWAGGGWVEVQLQLPLGATFGPVLFTAVQLEPSGASTLWEALPLEHQLASCQRYFETSYPLRWDGTPTNSYKPGDVIDLGVRRVFAPSAAIIKPLDTRFAVPKAQGPTVTWYDHSTGTVDQVQWSGARVVSSTTGSSKVSTGYPTVTTNPGSSALVEAHWAADAEPSAAAPL